MLVNIVSKSFYLVLSRSFSNFLCHEEKKAESAVSSQGNGISQEKNSKKVKRRKYNKISNTGLKDIEYFVRHVILIDLCC
jgi:hypothetical protein